MLSGPVGLCASQLANEYASSSKGGTISRKRCSAIGLLNPGASLARALFRALFEVGDHIGAVLRLVQVKEHLGAGRDSLRVGQPLVERLLVPDDIGRFERIRIVVVGERGGLAPEHPAMTRTDIVLVERVAILTGLVKRLAAIGVAGEPACPCGLGKRSRDCGCEDHSGGVFLSPPQKRAG